MVFKFCAQVQEQLITLCLRANSSSCDLNVASCSFITSVLTLATFSPTNRNWSWKFAETLSSHLPKGRNKKGKKAQLSKLISSRTGYTRVAAAFCKPAIPGRLLMLPSGVIYLHKQAQTPQIFCGNRIVAEEEYLCAEELISGLQRMYWPLCWRRI
jgi:hypothetical protein